MVFKNITISKDYRTTTKCVTYTQEQEGEKRDKNIFETIMTKDIPKLMSCTKPQIWEAQRTPNGK